MARFKLPTQMYRMHNTCDVDVVLAAGASPPSWFKRRDEYIEASLGSTLVAPSI